MVLCVPSHQRVDLSTFGELLQGVGPCGVEQPIPDSRAACIGRDERLGDQVLDTVDHIAAGHATVRGNGTD